jgi:hypothetical protein
VQWVPDRRIAVVRYVPPTPVPPPPPPPPPPPTPAPTPTPTPAPAAPTYLGFAQGAYMFHRISNEFAAQATTTGSYNYSGALLFDPFAIKAGLRSDQYNTTANGTTPVVPAPCTPSGAPGPGVPVTIFSTIDGGTCFTPQFKARQTLGFANIEYKIFNPHVYLGAGYLGLATNYGYPKLNGWGFGLEKLPDLTNLFTVHGSYFYYPNMHATYTVNDVLSPNNGVSYIQKYAVQVYDVGLDYVFSKQFPVYLYAGWGGDVMVARANAPINQTHSGPYVGLGFKF